MNTHVNELPVPAAAQDDDRAVELIRVWAAQGNQHVSIATGVWDDPAAWGIALVDLAKHVANAYQQSRGDDHLTVLERVKQGFDAEWDTATDEPSGGLQA